MPLRCYPSNPQPTMSPIDRRTFLKGVAVASAAAAGSAVAPGLLVAGSEAPVESSTGGVVWKKTPCRLCGVGCGLLVGVQGGRAVAVKGDPDSPVSRGLACVKGYHAVQALYGADRITRARVRRDGRLVEVPMSEALDLVARRLRETVARHGKDSVAVYGSGEWTVPDAYVASKLFKGALGTNNVETSARLHTASATAGLVSSFGLDGPVGCYEDIDHADLFVLWNENLAETSPVLFSRLLERRRRSPGVRIVELATRTTRTSYAADHSLLLTPQSELAVANAVCHEIVARRWVDRDFVERHVAFRKGRVGIGYDLTRAAGATAEGADVAWDDYVRFLAAYTPEHAQQVSGVPAEDIRWLASLYGDGSRKVTSIWGDGVNQHARGTWLNNLIYNIHLLVGKVAAPGNGPLCVTGQSEGAVAGALTAGLPLGSVIREEDRGLAARVWGVPVTRIDPRPTHTGVSMFQALDRGEIRFLWIQATDPMVALPNLHRYRKAAGREDRFLVVTDAYPTPTTDVADVVLPAALWIEREGIAANAERRVQHFERMLQPPGEAESEAWQMIEVARRLGFERLFAWERGRYVEEIWKEYSRFHTGPGRRLAPIAELRARPGVLWPFVEGRETRWRYNPAHDPAADGARGDFDFYGYPDHRARIWLRPYEPPAEAPDREYPFWLATGAVLEHSRTGSMTRRVPTLHRAMPRAFVELNPQDARGLGVRSGETVRLVSRRGSMTLEARVGYRTQPPRGQVFVPTFDETLPVNTLTLDAGCPLSGQPDYGKCAVRVERLDARVAR